MMIYNIVQEVRNIVLPIYCSMCGKFLRERMPMCDMCVRAIDPVAPLDISITRKYDISVAAAGRYDGPIVKYALAKHRGDVASVNELGWLMASRCYGILQHVDVLVPVPLHWRRFARRGFNQAEIIAQRISHETGIPYTRALRRVSWHGSQSERTPQERHENVRSAFELSISKDVIRNKRIALIDDVMATGATITSAAQVVRQASPAAIYGVVGVRGV